MKIRVLGCHGSDQVLDGDPRPVQCRTCGFLINGTVMVDAGTIGAALTLQEEKRIRHVLLSHLHFDHVQGFHKIGRPALPVYMCHLKPKLRAVIEEQLKRLHVENLTLLKEGQVIEI